MIYINPSPSPSPLVTIAGAVTVVVAVTVAVPVPVAVAIVHRRLAVAVTITVAVAGLLKITKSRLTPRVNDRLLFDAFNSLEDPSRYIEVRSGRNGCVGILSEEPL